MTQEEEKPYTFLNLVCNLAALAVEGALMVAGTTWIALHTRGGMGAAYVFAALIALLGVALGALQVHHYRRDNYLEGSEEHQ